MIYRIDEFIENRINPITQCEYDGSWIMLILTDSDEYQKFVGSKNECTYTVKISRRKCKDWMMDIGDFISFNEANGKNIILVMPEIDYLTVQDYYSGHSYNESVHRESEPVVLVHSTSMANWKKIQQDGMLKCWSRLKRENKTSETVPIGTALGDPVEFSDYIMFGEGITGEIVVNSKQTGRITMDVDSEYLTGARLYFDARKIAEAGFEPALHGL